MLLNLTELSQEPLHSQISRQLLDKIVDGELESGEELEPVRVLARTQRVGLHTVKRAYEELERDGLIKSDRARGFYVAPLTPEQRQEIAMQRMLGGESPLHVVEDLSRQLVSVFDPDKLRDIVARNMRTHLSVREVHFAIYNEAQEHYAVLPAAEHPDLFTVSDNDRILNVISRLRAPVTLEVLRVMHPDSPLVAALAAREVELVLPLHDGDRLLGFLALSGRRNRARFSAEELNLIVVLANSGFKLWPDAGAASRRPRARSRA